jgi:nitrite reductase (cytochrome c-552)
MRRRIFIWIGMIALVLLAAFGTTAVLVSVFEHKQEAKNPFFRVVELDDNTIDAAEWSKNFPLQFDGYRRTVDMARTRYGGSEAVPRERSSKDPREIVSASKIEADPRLKRMWAGYAFARDFREERGHAYMLEDQTFTERVTEFKQPGTCINCHASTYVAYKTLGDGDLTKGFEKLNQMPYEEVRKLVEHPVSCIDCHDPSSMQLRVTRPAFMEGIARVKKADGVENYDVNEMATRQEMRTFVCGQCHVEYYFAGNEKRLTFPWFKGRRADDALAYYDEIGFKDWTHAETGAPMLKAQHPEFELWSNGTHARAGVACADCHMPYMRVGAMKISDHHVRSPLLNIANACQTCHAAPEAELLARAERIQERTRSGVDLALNGLTQLIDAIVAAKAALPAEPSDPAANARLDKARDFHRKASFLIDYVEAENSSGFHADQEAMRVLIQAMDYLRQGQAALAAQTASASSQKP